MRTVPINCCPSCSAHGTVLDSRTVGDGSIRRRRECPQCQHRWSSYERNGHESGISHQRIRAATRKINICVAEIQSALAALTPIGPKA